MASPTGRIYRLLSDGTVEQRIAAAIILGELAPREKVVVQNHRKLVLCGVGTHVWGVLLVSELHRVFEFEDDVSDSSAKKLLRAAKLKIKWKKEDSEKESSQ